MYTSVEDRQVKQRMLDLQEKLIMKRALELLRTSNMNDDCKEENKQNLLHFTRVVASIMSSDNQDLLTPMQDGLAAKVTKMSPDDAATDEPIPIVGISRICELDAAIKNSTSNLSKPAKERKAAAIDLHRKCTGLQRCSCCNDEFCFHRGL